MLPTQLDSPRPTWSHIATSCLAPSIPGVRRAHLPFVDGSLAPLGGTQLGVPSLCAGRFLTGVTMCSTMLVKFRVHQGPQDVGPRTRVHHGVHAAATKSRGEDDGNAATTTR